MVQCSAMLSGKPHVLVLRVLFSVFIHILSVTETEERVMEEMPQFQATFSWYVRNNSSLFAQVSTLKSFANSWVRADQLPVGGGDVTGTDSGRTAEWSW